MMFNNMIVSIGKNKCKQVNYVSNQKCNNDCQYTAKCIRNGRLMQFNNQAAQRITLKCKWVLLSKMLHCAVHQSSFLN